MSTPLADDRDKADKGEDEEEIADDTLKSILAKDASESLPGASSAQKKSAAVQDPTAAAETRAPSVPPPEEQASSSGTSKAIEALNQAENGASALLVSRAFKVGAADAASYC